jgi:hypothetical protein
VKIRERDAGNPALRPSSFADIPTRTAGIRTIIERMPMRM